MKICAMESRKHPLPATVYLADGVGLPHVMLGAAGAVVTKVSIGVSCLRSPIPDVGLTVDPLEVMGTLSITVTCAVLSTSIAVLGFAAISIHMNKVEQHRSLHKACC